MECILSNLNWGTVPDWVMVGVTALTAMYVAKTLKSQTKVQKYQNKQLKIEQRRFAVENLPIFSSRISGYNQDISILNRGVLSHNNQYIVEIGVDLRLDKSYAKDVTVKLLFQNGTNWETQNRGNKFEYEFINEFEEIKIALTGRGQLSIRSQNELTNHVFEGLIIITIECIDTIGNNVSQEIYCYYRSDGEPYTHSNRPKIIKSIF